MRKMNFIHGWWMYILLILCASFVQSSRPLTPYQRSFTPVKNISCSQCEMKLEADGKKSFVETDMYRRRCADEPEIFFKPCPINDKNKPRGCGKLTTYVKEPVSKGRTREVTLMRRFCATEGAEPEEVKCVNRHSEGGFSEICICGSDNCNSAPQLSMKSTSFTYFFLFTFPYIYYLLSN